MSRYNLANLSRALSNPELVIGEARHIGSQINSLYHRNIRYRNLQQNIISKDWDNLILLDACRIDAYRQVTDNKSAKSVVSNATNSWEFMRKNFKNKNHHDTIYITANPFATRLDPSIFYHIDFLTEHSWNEERGTVMPSDVFSRSLELYDKYPNKKFIIHFMQPHYPFLGERGQKIDHTGYNRNQDESTDTPPNIWWVLQYGSRSKQGVTTNEVWEAYIENLELVMGYARDLAEEIPGKSVFSADHGTMIGDRVAPIPTKGYGHAHGAFVPPVVEVPWDIANEDDRRKITKEPPIKKSSHEFGGVNEQLEKLGYK